MNRLLQITISTLVVMSNFAYASSSSVILRMSRDGLRAFTKFDDLLVAAPKNGRYFDVGQNHKYLLTSAENGRAGAIDSLRFDDDGNVIESSFKLPSTTSQPSDIRIVSDTDNSETAGVLREFDLGYDRVAKQQEYYSVQKVKGRFMRVQTKNVNAIKDTKLTIEPDGDIYLISYEFGKGFPKKSKSTFMTRRSFNGDVISFRTDERRTQLTVQVAEGPNKIAEYQFALSLYEDNHPIDLGYITKKYLSQSEIEAAGIFAKQTTMPARTAASSATGHRGLRVNSAR